MDRTHGRVRPVLVWCLLCALAPWGVARAADFDAGAGEGGSTGHSDRPATEEGPPEPEDRPTVPLSAAFMISERDDADTETDPKTLVEHRGVELSKDQWQKIDKADRKGLGGDHAYQIFCFAGDLKGRLLLKWTGYLAGGPPRETAPSGVPLRLATWNGKTWQASFRAYRTRIRRGESVTYREEFDVPAGADALWIVVSCEDPELRTDAISCELLPPRPPAAPGEAGEEHVAVARKEHEEREGEGPGGVEAPPIVVLPMPPSPAPEGREELEETPRRPEVGGSEPPQASGPGPQPSASWAPRKLKAMEMIVFKENRSIFAKSRKKRDRVWRLRRFDGKKNLRYLGQVQGGRLEGRWSFFYPGSAQEMFTGVYEGGRKHGVWVYFRRSGRVKGTLEYHRGKAIGEPSAPRPPR